jgi:pimeloyl-ACP methyl ester carboxylesterase
MDELDHRLSAWDGLPLHVREWRDGEADPPVLCLPGIVRTGGDFAGVAAALGSGRRVIAPDYPGRGGSGRSRDPRRYAPAACVRDVLDICAALHVHDALAIGTSFGGLLCMALAAARPGLLRAVVLNDVGPDIGGGGAEFVRQFVATDPALENLDAAMAHLRRLLPAMSLTTDADWQAMTRLTYAPASDGRWRPLWDTRISGLLDGPLPDLWTLFGALESKPLLLVRGEASDILLPETVTRMRSVRPDMQVVALPGIGHAPTLGEPPVVAALSRFLNRIA